MVSGEPGKRNACDSFLKFLYDKESHTVLGRTCKSWGLIFVFYIIFYACLACFFVGMLSVHLFGVLPSDRPYLTGEQSILRFKPGLGHYPRKLDDYNSIDGKLVRANTDPTNEFTKIYISGVNATVNPYRFKDGNQNNLIACDATKNTRADDDPTKACKFDLALLGDCKYENLENVLKEQSICVYFSMNKIYGWLPRLVDNFTTPTIKCRGENPADKENILERTYFPAYTAKAGFGSFSHAWFPYLNQTNFLPQLVAMRLKLVPNVLVLMTCWIEGDASGQEEFLRIEVLLDDLNAKVATS